MNKEYPINTNANYTVEINLSKFNKDKTEPLMKDIISTLFKKNLISGNPEKKEPDYILYDHTEGFEMTMNILIKI